MVDVSKEIRDELRIRPAQIKRKLVGFIKGEVKDAGAEGVVLGLSGGLDSTVAAFLCVEALGNEKVLAVSMPEAGVTDPQDVADALKVANELGIGFRVVDITSAVQGIRRNLGGFEVNETISTANLKPRIRMMILYYHANSLNRLVVGTSNRSEIRAGYFTKYGDGASDLAPLGCLYKTQVASLAKYLKVPDYILCKPPSAGLWRGQTDESELGLPYKKLDKIYAGLDLDLEQSDIANATGVKVKDVSGFIKREERAKHKLAGPKIPSL